MSPRKPPPLPGPPPGPQPRSVFVGELRAAINQLHKAGLRLPRARLTDPAGESELRQMLAEISELAETVGAKAWRVTAAYGWDTDQTTGDDE